MMDEDPAGNTGMAGQFDTHGLLSSLLGFHFPNDKTSDIHLKILQNSFLRLTNNVIEFHVNGGSY